MRTERFARRASCLVVVVGALALGGCAAAPPVTPAGFAAYRGDEPFRALSPDGVIYRVRREGNPGHAPLAFWKEVLASRMQAAGYQVRGERPIGGGAAEPGYLIDLALALGTEERGYLIAVFARPERLTIVEASGATAALDARRAAIVAAIESSRP